MRTAATANQPTLQRDANALILANTTLYFAAWNYYLIEGDGSEGIHNPTFVCDILDATMEQVEGMP